MTLQVSLYVPIVLCDSPVGAFRREHAVPMAASRVTDLDPQLLERGFTWSHRLVETGIGRRG